MPISKEYFSEIGKRVEDWLQTPSGKVYAKKYGESWDKFMAQYPPVDPNLLARIRDYATHCAEHADTVDALMPGSHRSTTYRQLANDMAAVVLILDHLPVTPIYTDREKA